MNLRDRMRYLVAPRTARMLDVTQVVVLGHEITGEAVDWDQVRAVVGGRMDDVRLAEAVNRATERGMLNRHPTRALYVPTNRARGVFAHITDRMDRP